MLLICIPFFICLIMRFSIRIFIFSLSLFHLQISEAQNFSYNLTKDSVLYQPLSSVSTVAEKEDWTNKKFSINLPFQFNCAGIQSDSLTIESHGFISFGKNTNLALVAFNNFLCSTDTAGEFVSEISYTVSGSTGTRIAKLEFKNLAVSTYSPGDYLTYQLWFYEGTNKIAFHIGPNACANSSLSSFPELLGLIRRKMDSTVNGYLATGNPSSPTGMQLTGELSYINKLPGAGTIFTFTPTF